MVDPIVNAVWEWWYSRDGENYQGPCDSREQAIEEGRELFGDEAFEIAEATKGTLRTFIADRAAEWLDEASEEQGDPDGNPISEDIKASEWTDLFERLDKADNEWIKVHNLDRHVWAFDQIRNREDVPAVEEDACPSKP